MEMIGVRPIESLRLHLRGRRLCFYLYRELRLSIPEIARLVGVWTTGVVMAIEGIIVNKITE
jgi:hypothetical protein